MAGTSPAMTQIGESESLRQLENWGEAMSKLLSAMLVSGALLPFGVMNSAAQQMTKDEIAQKIVGSWRYIGTWVDGAPRNRGANPQGMIVYTAGGHMSVQIAPDRPRTKAGAEATPEEAQAALKDYIAYFGTYSIDDKTGVVTHHRLASIQPGDTAPFQRAPEFKGDRLILRPPGSKQEIVWERIK
jgi:hypothetical protein